MNQSGQLRKPGFSHKPAFPSDGLSRRAKPCGNEKGRMARSNMPVPTPRTALRTHHTSREPAQRRHRRFPTTFCSTLRRTPPSIPPSLLRFVSELDQEKNSTTQNTPGPQQAKKKDSVGPGRVKVLLRVCPERALPPEHTTGQQPPSRGSILRVEGNRKHVTIFDSESGLQSAQMKVGVSAPKLYAFDAVFPEDAPQVEVCSTSLIDVIQAVLQGADGAVFCYGHSGLGKTHTLIGSDANEGGLGLIPCAISWLYRAIDEVKEKTKGRFSVRVSAIEVHGRTEELKDLLKEHAKDDAPGEELCVREDPLFGTQLQNQCELRASSMEKAAYLLDAALASRSSSRAHSAEEARRHSHMVYTLHVYQYRLDKTGKTGVSGGRSRLHFIDLGSCERTLVKTPNSLTLSLNSLGHVIMAIINNSKHVPFKESKLTLVLQDLLGNFNCRTVMLAHVAKASKHYADTMSTVQMASRIHRVLIKRKTKGSTGAGSVRGVGCHVSKSMKSHRMRGTDDESLGTSSGVGETSGSEVSCDTVIYVRPNGVPFSDRELTDNEGPPPAVPIRTPPQSVKSLSKITENEQTYSGQKSQSKHGEMPSTTTTKNQRQVSRLPVSNTELHSHRTPPNTQQKLANHAKLLSHIGEGDRRHQRFSKPSENGRNDRKFETTASDKRKHSKIPSVREEKTSQAKKSSIPLSSKSTSKKSKIPPPPPPRLPTTRLRHDSSETKPITETPKQLRSVKKETKFHQPTYETLHASHHPRENASEASKQSDVKEISQSFGEEELTCEIAAADLNQNFDMPGVNEVSMVGRVSVSREEPDGCDGASRITKTYDRTAIVNLSYSTVSLDGSSATKKDISRCIQDFNDVLNSVEEGDVDGIHDVTNMASQPPMRPDSMFVNVNDNDWNSDDSDDTLTGDIDVSDGDDVIDVNFYCLSFSTKNPLIPLSKRSFVRQISRTKRLSSEGHGNSGESTGDTKWAEKVNRTFPPEKCDSSDVGDDLKAEIYEGPCSEPDVGRIRRSSTFEVKSQPPKTLLPAGSCLEDSDVESPEEITVSVDGNSTVSSPSQVLLYDSSSLEINYVKPKSFHDINQPQSTTNSEEKKDKGPSAESCIQKSTQACKSSAGFSRKDGATAGDKVGKRVLVAGSGNGDGAQLSLVRSTGTDAATTLELVITSEDSNESPGCVTSSKENRSNTKRINGGKKANQPSAGNEKFGNHKEGNYRRSKWPGFKRFGSKREKLVSDKSRESSPAQGRSFKKVENPVLEGVKASTSSGSSFVSKLLSPKLKRGQKTSFGVSTSADFRYRSPNVISQMRPDIVRTTNTSTSAEHLDNIRSKGKSGKNNGRQGGMNQRDEDTGTSQNATESVQITHNARPTMTRNRFGFSKKMKS